MPSRSPFQFSDSWAGKTKFVGSLLGEPFISTKRPGKTKQAWSYYKHAITLTLNVSHQPTQTLDGY